MEAYGHINGDTQFNLKKCKIQGGTQKLGKFDINSCLP